MKQGGSKNGEDCPICGSGDCHGHSTLGVVVPFKPLTLDGEPIPGPTHPDPEEPTIPADDALVWTNDMGDISGLDLAYEFACRRMFFAGIRWMFEKPERNPAFRVYKQLPGMALPQNTDADILCEVLVRAAQPEGMTAAMHQAVLGHVLACRRLGWDAYCAELRRRHAPKEPT